MTSTRISKLDLHSGDTLVIMVPERLDENHRALYRTFLENAVPEGIKFLVLDGGVTLDKIRREQEAEFDTKAYQAAFYPVVDQPVQGWRNMLRRWMKALQDDR